RRITMDRHAVLGAHGTLLIDRPTQHIHDPAQRFQAYRNGDPGSRVLNSHPAAQSFRRAETDGAHHAVAKLLLNFERQIAIVQRQGIVDLWKLIARKFDVDHRADALDYCSLVHALSLNSNS